VQLGALCSPESSGASPEQAPEGEQCLRLVHSTVGTSHWISPVRELQCPSEVSGALMKAKWRGQQLVGWVVSHFTSLGTLGPWLILDHT
jgi:hypothetical protein